MSKKKSLPAATDRGIRKISGKTDTATKGPGNQDFHSCPQCAFFRAIQLPSGYIRTLCQFTGEKRPYYAMPGCRFIRGAWENLDGILGLTRCREAGKLAIPNCMRPGNGLDHSQDGQKVARHSTAIHAYADIYGNRALHIGRAQRPHDREAAAASYRPGSVGALPFCF